MTASRVPASPAVGQRPSEKSSLVNAPVLHRCLAGAHTQTEPGKNYLGKAGKRKCSISSIILRIAASCLEGGFPFQDEGLIALAANTTPNAVRKAIGRLKMNWKLWIRDRFVWEVRVTGFLPEASKPPRRDFWP